MTFSDLPATEKGSAKRVPPKTKLSQGHKPRIKESSPWKLSKTERNKISSDTSENDNDCEAGFNSLFDETREACVNIENVKDGPEYELFTDNNTLSDLIAEAEAESSLQDRMEGEALIEECPRQKTKSNQNSTLRYTYDCFKCGKKFRNRAPLNLHIASEHNEDGGLGLLCSDCGKQVDYDHELDLHKKFFCKKVKKTFKCFSCKLSFITESERDLHPCTRDVAKPYYCMVDGCYTHSRNVKDLTEHVTRHLGIKPFLCNICGRAFSAKKDMDRHSDIHKDSNDYVCQVCGRSFKSYHTLRRHVFVHKYKDRYKCDQCPYTTAMKSSYTQHLIKHKQRMHKCHICDKNLRSAKSLAKHIQNRHTFNRIFTCRYCDFTTDVGLSYSSHMRNHSDLKETDYSIDSSFQEIPLDLSDHGEANSQFNSLSSSGNLQEIMSTDFHSNISFTVASSSVRDDSVVPMLADVGAYDHDGVDISGQSTIITNLIDSTDATEISVIPAESTNSNIVLYSIGIPVTSLNVTSFISDAATAVSDIDNWTDSVT